MLARLVTTAPWTTTFWRSLFAAAFLALVVSVVRRRSVVALWRDGGRPLIATATCMALASTCFIFSLAHTTVANTLLLMSTGPFVAALLGRLALGELVAPRTWLGMGVALAGVVVMVSRSHGRGIVVGDLLAMVDGVAKLSQPGEGGLFDHTFGDLSGHWLASSGAATTERAALRASIYAGRSIS